MDELIVAYSGNLSRGGMRLRTSSPLPVGSAVELTIELPDGLPELRVPCLVVFVKPPAEPGGKHDVGIKFVDPVDEARQRLEWYVLNSEPESGQFAGKPYARRLDIVVVEDDPLQREATAAPFRARGDQARLAADGLQGLAMCLQKAPDVVLSDVQMPKMDGWQLLRMVRARPALKHVPVIFLTTLQGDAERLLGYRLGVDDYLGKPHRPEELLARTDRAVTRAEQLAASATPEHESGLRGDLVQVSLASVLAFLEMEQKTGILRVGPVTNGFIAVRQGYPVVVRVIGAPADATAEDLVLGLLDLREGRFEFTSREVTDPDSVGTTVTGLLLEHARRHDEMTRRS
jgi:DNA-binding response OmpR family regulator/Tfp pilus assembly protein PilZ